ncbi:hypothetical protein Tco_1328777 [Tanacetum coccineum]
MVACLERTEENAEFHQIVDFLTTSSIHYALTVSPTIYASYIEQFWNTANSQTVNDVKQIHATVDGKTVVISESSVRSDLHFNDEDGITYLTNTAIFENIALMGGMRVILTNLLFKKLSSLLNGSMLRNLDTNTKKFLMYLRKRKDFSGRVTPLFASMLAPPVVGGKGSGQPSEPQPPSSTTRPIIKEQIPVTELSSPQNTQSPRQALQKDTQLPRTSVPIPNVADEAVFKERDDRVVRATTTAASLDAAQTNGNITKTQSTAMSNDPLSQEVGSGDRPKCQEAMGGAIAHTRYERASKHSYDSPLPEVNIPGCDEERNEQHDLTDFVPPTPHDLPLSGGHTPGSDEDLVINKLQKKVKRLEKALRARTPGMKLFKISTSRRKGLDKENVSKQGRKSDKTKPMFKDSEFDVLDDAMENVKGGSTAKQITTAGDTLNTASINVSTARPSNGSAAGPFTSTTGDIFEDEMTTIANTLVAIRSARPRTTSVVIRNVKEEPRSATPVPTVQSQDKGKGKMVKPEPTPKNPRKAHIQMDEELAQRAAEQEAKDAALIEQMEDVQARMDANELLAARLQEQERELFSVDEHARFLVETIAARKRFFAAQRAAETRNRPPTRTQLRNQMITYLKHMGNDDSGKKNDSSSKQAESNKKRPRVEHDEERDDIAIDVESLATKYPIVDWKTHILAENMMYYQIIIADGSFKNYKIFSEMLDDFNRQDVMDLHRLVKERYDTISPEGYDLLLWGDLKTLFEPCEENEVWRNQQGYNLIS